MPPQGNKLNCGSGQRPFDREHGWINIDIESRWSPDLVADWNNLTMFEDGSMDLVVSCHSIEHVGCGEAGGFIKESFRVLRNSGSLIVLVPDMKALARRWLTGQIDDQLYMTNVYGAYMGNNSDRHAWGFSRESLRSFLKQMAPWREIMPFDYRAIPGSDLPRDWWMISVEAVK